MAMAPKIYGFLIFYLVVVVSANVPSSTRTSRFSFGACTGCPQNFCDDDPAVIYGYCCGCARLWDVLPVRCQGAIRCPLNGYELCERYEYMMRCCCAK